MDPSTIALLSKEGSSVPASQVPTASQPQSAAIGGNTTTTIESSARASARTPVHPNAPAPRVRPWTEARVVAPNTYHEGYTVPVIQPTSGLPAVTTETSAGTLDAIGASNASTSASTSGLAISSASNQGRRHIRIPANQIAPNVPNYHASYCEFTKEDLDIRTMKVVTIPVPVLAQLILKDAIEARTSIADLKKWWNVRLTAFTPATREFDVVTTVLALIDQRDPNYALRVKQREQANRLAELEDNFLKHKVTSETDVPSYRFPYEPRKIAHMKRPAANHVSYNTGANKASAQPSVSPGGPLNQMPIFGRPGGGAASQPGASPFFHYKRPNFGGRDAGIRRFPKE